MTTLANTLIHSPLAAALADCGWQPDDRGTGWTHETPTSTAQLQLLDERADFQRFKLIGGALDGSSNSRVLGDNFTLSGPLKFVARRSCAPFCRVDVPADLEASMSERFVAADDPLLAEPLVAWASVITACACGQPLPTAAPLDPHATLEELKRQGWVGSVDDGQLNLHVNVVGVFRKVRVEQGEHGARLATELADLSGYSKPSQRAALRLAHETNARLPLVRLSRDEQQAPQVLRAEVCWGTASIPGAWLTTALEVVEAAIALAAREMAALRDPELANLVLAAPGGPTA